MPIEPDNQRSRHWTPSARLGFWLFTAVYFTYFLLFLFFTNAPSDTPSSVDQLHQQQLPGHLFLNVFLSFLPLALLSPALGIHLGKLVCRSKGKYWAYTLASGIIFGILFIYWSMLIHTLSKTTGVGGAVAGYEASAAQAFVIYPLAFSIPFLATNLILSSILLLFSKRRPNPPLNSDPA